LRRALTRTLIALALFLAAASAGYFLSSRLGQEILRQQIEERLSRLMQGALTVESARLVFHLGLHVEADRVEVYPGPAGPGLEASHVDASVDVLSLLVGRFRLRSLRIDDALMRIERSAEGRFSPHPLAALQDRPGRPPDDPEGRLAIFRAFEAIAHTLLDRGLVANLVVVRSGTVQYVDRLARPPGEPPLTLSLEGINGEWDHRWLSDQPELSARAILVDELQRRTRIEVEGRRLDEHRLRWSVAATDLPLDVVQPYARLLRAERLVGQLSGVFAFETLGEESDSVEIDWVASDVEFDVPWRADEPAHIEGERTRLKARLELLPARVRLVSARLAAGRGTLQASGFVERPLRESSRARLNMEVVGLDFDALRYLGRSLPPVDRATFLRIFDSVETGRLTRVRASASSRVSAWTELLERRRLTLPPGFLVGAEVEGATVLVGARRDTRIDSLSGTIEWAGDRLETRDVKADWQGSPLPRLNLSIEGISHLFEAPLEVRTVRAGAQPLPGAGVLSDWLRSLGGGEPEAGAPPIAWPAVHLHVDEIQHPAALWPLRDANLTLQMRSDGLDLLMPDGLWAGAPVHGEAVLVEGDERRFSVSLSAGTPAATPGVAPDPAPAPAGDAVAPWLRGQFAVDAFEQGPLAFSKASGTLKANGARLALKGVEIQLTGGGRIDAQAQLDLSHDDTVPVDLALKLSDGDVSRLVGVFGLPPETATGRIAITGSLSGPLSPGVAPWSRASGRVTIDARNGEIRRRLPLVVAMAKATEGFNPFSAREAVTYESIRSDLVMTDGVLSADDFRLEGPMRVFASGSLDLRGKEAQLDAVVGVFLLRQADQLLGKVPLVSWLVSDKGMIGAYFALRGPVGDPAIDTLEGRTLAEQFPDVVKAPFRVLQYLLTGGGSSKEDSSSPDVRKKTGLPRFEKKPAPQSGGTP